MCVNSSRVHASNFKVLEASMLWACCLVCDLGLYRWVPTDPTNDRFLSIFFSLCSQQSRQEVEPWSFYSLYYFHAFHAWFACRRPCPCNYLTFGTVMSRFIVQYFIEGRNWPKYNALVHALCCRYNAASIDRRLAWPEIIVQSPTTPIRRDVICVFHWTALWSISPSRSRDQGLGSGVGSLYFLIMEDKHMPCLVICFDHIWWFPFFSLPKV